ELIGTCTLVFIGTATAVFAGSGILGPGGGMGILAIAFAFGFTLLVLVYAIGPTSGCHVNPAVTIAMLVARKIGVQDGIAYIIAQVIGAFLASLVLLGILSGVRGSTSAGIAEYSRSVHGLGANDVPPFLSVSSALGFEVVLTALFLYVIFNATSSAAKPETAGLAIGGYLFVAHLIGVPLGDSSLNPARSIGPAILQGGTALVNVWVFIVAPIIGGLIGFVLFRITSKD
ncbi:MAG: aquaporin, partial [Nitrospiraceae bacterium]